MSKKELSFLNGSVLGSLVKFAVPVLGALVLQAAYGAVDLLVVGWFGDASSLSAVGTGSQFMQMITFIVSSLAMGSTVIIGQHIGERNPKGAGRTIGTSIVFFAILTVAVTVVLEITSPFFAGILKIPSEAKSKYVAYTRICSGGMLVIIAYNLISGVLRGIGNSKLPFIFVCVACIVNIIGDFILVGIFKLDVVGAAIATIAAQTVSVVISAAVIRKQNMPVEFSRKNLVLDRDELVSILKIGVPIALQEIVVEISFLLMAAIINGMGLAESAGYSVAGKINAFVMLVPAAVMQSVTAFVSQNIGAGQKERAFAGFRTAAAAGVLTGVAIFIGVFFFGDIVSRGFTSDPNVISQSFLYLRGFAPECMLTCILFSSIGYFNGCGRGIPVMIQGLASTIAVRIPYALLMASLPNTNLFKVGTAAPVTTVFGIAFFAVCFIIYGKKDQKESD